MSRRRDGSRGRNQGRTSTVGLCPTCPWKRLRDYYSLHHLKERSAFRTEWSRGRSPHVEGRQCAPRTAPEVEHLRFRPKVMRMTRPMSTWLAYSITTSVRTETYSTPIKRRTENEPPRLSPETFICRHKIRRGLGTRVLGGSERTEHKHIHQRPHVILARQYFLDCCYNDLHLPSAHVLATPPGYTKCSETLTTRNVPCTPCRDEIFEDH